jgi:hypothetical protein
MLIAAWGAPASLAAAGPYDGSRPLLCAVDAIAECDSSGRCERHLPDVNAPRFIRVDVAGKAITADGNRRSPLGSTMHVDGELILQGGENGRGWSATIDEETGRMAVALVDNDYTFSFFGACTIP